MKAKCIVSLVVLSLACIGSSAVKADTLIKEKGSWDTPGDDQKIKVREKVESRYVHSGNAGEQSRHMLVYVNDTDDIPPNVHAEFDPKSDVTLEGCINRSPIHIRPGESVLCDIKVNGVEIKNEPTISTQGKYIAKGVYEIF